MLDRLDLTYDLGTRVLVVISEPDELLAGLRMQISVLVLLHLQLLDALLEPPQLRHVQQQSWAQVGRQRVVSNERNLADERRRKKEKRTGMAGCHRRGKCEQSKI